MLQKQMEKTKERMAVQMDDQSQTMAAQMQAIEKDSAETQMAIKWVLVVLETKVRPI